MPEMLDTRAAQGRYAAAVRWGHSDRDELARDLAEARICALIAKLAVSTPPLRADQIGRIAARLHFGGDR